MPSPTGAPLTSSPCASELSAYTPASPPTPLLSFCCLLCFRRSLAILLFASIPRLANTPKSVLSTLLLVSKVLPVNSLHSVVQLLVYGDGDDTSRIYREYTCNTLTLLPYATNCTTLTLGYTPSFHHPNTLASCTVHCLSQTTVISGWSSSQWTTCA